MLKGFKEFIMRGNVIDLAVAVVVGTAFTALVTAIVDNLINPLIGAIFRADSLDTSLIVTIPGLTSDAEIRFGAVLGAVLTFLIVASVVYFVFVFPINKMRETADAKLKKGEAPAEDEPLTELALLSEIRDLLADRGQAAPSGKHSD